MAREIRFRAWNKSDNCFWYFNLITLRTDPLLDGFYLKLEQPQQFAGLKDKNSVEIYAFMDSHIKSVIQSEIKGRVQMLMEDFVTKGKVKGGYSSDPEMTIPEYISKVFSNSRPDITKHVDTMAAIHIKKMKDQYDMLFATQIVHKIKEQGLLKEEAAKMLLQETPVS